MLCENCLHKDLCVVRAKLRESTVFTFPDGKTAVLDMEAALIECEHLLDASSAYVGGDDGVTFVADEELPPERPEVNVRVAPAINPIARKVKAGNMAKISMPVDESRFRMPADTINEVLTKDGGGPKLGTRKVALKLGNLPKIS